MVVVPTPTIVTCPVLFTVATLVSELVNVTKRTNARHGQNAYVLVTVC